MGETCTRKLQLLNITNYDKTLNTYLLQQSGKQLSQNHRLYFWNHTTACKHLQTRPHSSTTRDILTFTVTWLLITYHYTLEKGFTINYLLHSNTGLNLPHCIFSWIVILIWTWFVIWTFWFVILDCWCFLITWWCFLSHGLCLFLDGVLEFLFKNTSSCTWICFITVFIHNMYCIIFIIILYMYLYNIVFHLKLMY